MGEEKVAILRSVVVPGHSGRQRDRIWSAFAVVRPGIGVVWAVFVLHGLFRDHTWRVVVHRSVGQPLYFSWSVAIRGHLGRQRNRIWSAFAVVRFGIGALWAVFVLPGMFRDHTWRVVVHRCVG